MKVISADFYIKKREQSPVLGGIFVYAEWLQCYIAFHPGLSPVSTAGGGDAAIVPKVL
jgi:hypothetical protein